jgi:hypothetical protein
MRPSHVIVIFMTLAGSASAGMPPTNLAEMVQCIPLNDRLEALRREMCPPTEESREAGRQAQALAELYRKLTPQIVDALPPRPPGATSVSPRVLWSALNKTYEGPLDPVPYEVAARALIPKLEEQGLFDSLKSMRVHRGTFSVSKLENPAYGGWEGDSAALQGACEAATGYLRVLVERGNFPGYGSIFEGALAAGQACTSEPTFITFMMARVAQQRLFAQARDEILRGSLRGDVCRSLIRAIDDHPLPDAKFLYEGERLDGLHRIGSELLPGGPAPRAPAERTRVKEENEALYNRYMDAAIALLGPDPAAQRAAKAVLAEISAKVDAEPERYAVGATKFPSVDSEFASRMRHELFREGVRTMLALELYREAHGRYPDELKSLVPEILAKLPGDPWNAGRPFGYKRVVGVEGLAAREYVLYTVGRDGTDNGGKPSERPVNALGPGPAGVGFDYTINVRE